jgi:hypothetical protein
MSLSLLISFMRHLARALEEGVRAQNKSNKGSNGLYGLSEATQHISVASLRP